jgi:hypothetical protein
MDYLQYNMYFNYYLIILVMLHYNFINSFIINKVKVMIKWNVYHFINHITLRN